MRAEEAAIPLRLEVDPELATGVARICAAGLSVEIGVERQLDIFERLARGEPTA
jgi:hypothetical protein